MGATGTPSAGSGSGSSGSTSSIGTTPPTSGGSTGGVSTTSPTSSGGTTYSQNTLAGFYTSPPVMESNRAIEDELKS